MTELLPFYLVVMFLAIGTGLVSMVLQSRMIDFKQMGQQQQRMDSVRERLENAQERDDEDAVERIRDEQMEMMGDQLGTFTQMLRPLVWTMLFTIPVFLWLYWLMVSPAQAIAPTTIVFPMIGQVAWTTRVIGPIQAWILWYGICSISSRQLIQKSLNIQTSPT